jgi:hypothetical protein
LHSKGQALQAHTSTSQAQQPHQTHQAHHTHTHTEDTPNTARALSTPRNSSHTSQQPALQDTKLGTDSTDTRHQAHLHKSQAPHLLSRHSPSQAHQPHQTDTPSTPHTENTPNTARALSTTKNTSHTSQHLHCKTPSSLHRLTHTDTKPAAAEQTQTKPATPNTPGTPDTPSTPHTEVTPYTARALTTPRNSSHTSQHLHFKTPGSLH